MNGNSSSSLLLLLGLAAFLFFMMYMSSRTRKKQQAERENMISGLAEGVWVLTIGRMYGRVVDIDGDVVTLESADGSELMFDKTAIAAIKEPPVGSDNETETAYLSESDKAAGNEDKDSDSSVITDFNNK